jgi:hypothetical protein
MTGERKISEEKALKDFQSLLDYYDMEPDDLKDIKVDQGDVMQSFEYTKKRIVRAITKGRIEIKNEGGRPIIVHHLTGQEKKLEYKPVSGKAKLEMGKIESNNNERLYTLMGVLCGEGKTTIQGLEGPDLSLVEVLGNLFLLV